MIKDKVEYEFHGSHGWYDMKGMDEIKNDIQAKTMVSYIRTYCNDKTVKAYRVTKHYDEVK